MPFTTRNLCLTMAAVLSIAAATGAQNAHAATPENNRSSDAAKVQELDEIMVRGTRIRVAIANAEDEFFGLYNKLNRNNDFSANCVDIPLGDTQIRSHLCIPGFMADAIADQAYFAALCEPMSADSPAPPCYTPPPPQAVLTERSKDYANHLMKVIRSDERLGMMAGNLDDLYHELVSIQQEYIKVNSLPASALPSQLLQQM